MHLYSNGPGTSKRRHLLYCFQQRTDTGCGRATLASNCFSVDAWEQSGGMGSASFCLKTSMIPCPARSTLEPLYSEPYMLDFAPTLSSESSVLKNRVLALGVLKSPDWCPEGMREWLPTAILVSPPMIIVAHGR